MAMSEEQRFDGLSKDEAIRSCVRRHAELSSSQLKFINAIGARDKQLTKEQASRLTAIMEKFRQGDLVSHLDTCSGHEAPPTVGRQRQDAGVGCGPARFHADLSAAAAGEKNGERREVCREERPAGRTGVPHTWSGRPG